MNDEKRADLITHLTELRARLIRGLVYVVLAMAAVWVFFDPLYRFMVRPVRRPLEEFGGELTVRMLLEGLLVKLEIVLVAGVIFASPLIVYEIWAFVAPGLTGKERRVARPLIPAAMLLFLAGVTMGYLLTGPAVRALLRFIPPETAALLTLNDTILLLLKFYLAFGLGFQLPIVIVLLAKLGLIDSRLLISRWREATVGIFILAAIITPTWDPITLTIAAIPMVLLYMGTIAVVKLIEAGERRARRGNDSLAG
ncbi:MAG TPA: twin-arginine translocase subunit TatC [Armatimonadota bacterium]|nr:twin-arginine translocase subunit TatC [Armatimonadota bacterium]